MNTFFRKFVPALVLLALVIAAFPTPAYASPAAQDEQPAVKSRDPNKLIVLKFKQEQRRFERQSRGDGLIARFLERVETTLARAEEQGLDPSAVESALADFETARAASDKLTAQAGDLIDAHAGFDAGGKVADAAIAAQTVEDIHLLLDQARDGVTGEREALQHALWDLFQTGLGK